MARQRWLSASRLEESGSCGAMQLEAGQSLEVGQSLEADWRYEGLRLEVASSLEVRFAPLAVCC